MFWCKQANNKFMSAIICIICILVLLTLLVFLPMRCNVSVLFSVHEVILDIKLGFLFGLIKIPVKADINIIEEFQKRNRKKKKRKSKTLDLLRYIIDGGLIKELEINSRIGIGVDAFLSVMTSGFVQILFEKLSEAFLKTEKVGIFIKPCFSSTVFWVHLEGILIIFPTQIIGIMVLKGR